MTVTQNLMNDSSLSGAGITSPGAAAGTDATDGNIGTLVDVSLPATNGESLNPFTDENLELKGKDATEVS